MKENDLKNISQTDWERVASMTDEEIDTSDIPPLDDDFFAHAELRLPEPKQSVTIRLDADVVEWFKAQGKGYQTRMNAVLRRYMEVHT
jgi:uncharacterized protein (DUF4415 family)